MKRMKHIFSKLHSNQKGYLTVECTLVFSVLFFSLLLILFMGMVLYQEVDLQSLAVRASERGSVIYSSRVSDMTTGEKKLSDFNIRDPYRNVPFMDNGVKEDYKSVVNTYVAANLGKYDVISGEVKNNGNYVTIEDNLITKKIKVNIKSGYRMPVDSIARMFGKNGPFEVDTTAVSAVVDSPDFVRNVDLTMDLVRKFTNIDKGYTEIYNALQKMLNALK